MNPSEVASAGIHPIELCVHSILSSNLEGIYQAITELRESQALLIMKFNQVKKSFTEEQELLQEEGSLKEELARMNQLKKRLDKLTELYAELSRKCSGL
ncbi:AaceriAER412Wp [[Ashbya] aceris (nom. inval.)]|nr:AaceriAER412Wp [[Ashbya] aceris (nom. inval.)]